MKDPIGVPLIPMTLLFWIRRAHPLVSAWPHRAVIILRHLSDCGTPTTYARVTINAPTPKLDLVISVRHGNGVEEELFRSHVPTDPPPHVEASLGLGDSVRVHYALTGYCGFGQYITIRTNNGPEDATDTDPLLTSGVGSAQDISFRGQARYLIRLYGAGCYTPQEVYLHTTITYLHTPSSTCDWNKYIPMEHRPLCSTQSPGDQWPSGPLHWHRRIRSRSVGSCRNYPCTGIVLKVYRSESDTATTMDPLFLDQPLEYARFDLPRDRIAAVHIGGYLRRDHRLLPILSVSEALSTGISTSSEAGFNAFYANDLLLVDTRTGGLLEVRNLARWCMRSRW